MPLKFRRVCLAGVGLIGGSMALAMRRKGIADEIIGVGRGLDNLKAAKKLGIITSYTREMALAAQDADLIILATPVRAMPPLVRSFADQIKRKAILTDVGSVKAGMIQEILPLIDQRVDFVPAHPIAGREKSGARHADPEIFKGRWTIITPAPKSSPAGIERIKRLWQALGARVEIMDPLSHDRILAGISHLPHMVAYALVAALLEMDQKTPMLRFSAGGFRDFIRIAGSSPEMWRDICLENKEQILAAIDRYQVQMASLREMIAREKADELEKLFSRCRAVKERVGKGNG